MTARVPTVLGWTMLMCATIGLLASSTATGDSFVAVGSAPATRLRPPPRSFSLIATGDVLTESPVTFAAASFAAGSAARYDFAPLFLPVMATLSSADLAICHMEMPIGSPGQRDGVYGRSPFGGNQILAPFEIAADLRSAGFDRCSTASNHSFDLAETGVDTTLAALDAAGITHTGTARSPAETSPALLTINGIRVAHLAYTRYSNTVLPAEPWRVNFANSAEGVAADVKAARSAGAEVVIVSVHISQELLSQPLPDDRQFVTDLTALAHIDLVIEHGPHVIQPVEFVNGTWVYWSVGNFISGMGGASRGKYSDPRTLDGVAAGARFTETSSGTFTVEPWPVLLCNDVVTRAVYAPMGVPSPPLDDLTRAHMDECIRRSVNVVPQLH